MWPLKSRRTQPATRGGEPSKEWRKRNTFLFGGQEVPIRMAEFNTILSGGIGTGKTTALIALMTSLIEAQIASGIPFNTHMYTPRFDDFYHIMKRRLEPLGVSVRATNPFLRDSWSWDGAISLDTQPRMDELAVTIIKDDAKDNSRYFRQAAQLALRGVIQSLAATHPGLWTMRQVACILRDPRLTEHVLARTANTRHIVTLFDGDQGTAAANLRSTLLAELKNLDLVAALIDQTPDSRRFSIAQAANKPNVVWVWSSDPRYNATIEPWNSVQFSLIAGELLIRGDIGMDTYMFIDEFPQMNGGQPLPAIRKLLEFGRGSRVRNALAIQTPSQVKSTYGEPESDTILGQCHNAMVFRHADYSGQQHWSQRLGKERGFEAKKSYSRQTSGGWSSGPQPSRSGGWADTENSNIERFDIERVTPSNIGDLPVGSYEFGMYGYASLPISASLDPETGYPLPIKWRFHLTPEWIAKNVPQKGTYTPYNRRLKPEASYTLDPLRDYEYAFLNLPMRP